MGNYINKPYKLIKEKKSPNVKHVSCWKASYQEFNSVSCFLVGLILFFSIEFTFKALFLFSFLNTSDNLIIQKGGEFFTQTTKVSWKFEP